MNRPSLRIAVVFFLLVVFPILVAAQQQTVPSRIVQAVSDAQLISLKGNVHPLARAQFDRGPAPSGLPMQRMLLVLKHSAEQQTALTRLLDAQQDRNSRDFHRWLTPEEFGRSFGPSDDDIKAITGWLQGHGFEIGKVSNGRTIIEFSGTAGQVGEAFHSEIHKYAMNGEEHWANASDLQIPAALAPVVAGVNTLHNFYKKPLHVMADRRVSLPPSLIPEITGADGSHALVPADYAVIYNINPVYAQGIHGEGTTVAVVGRTDFMSQDIFDFRNIFGLPIPSLSIVLNGPSPGITSTDEQAEATLDVSWSGAIAPGAKINFVLSASTNSTDGVDLSELYIVDNNIGDVMTESFGQCEEAFKGTGREVAISQLAEQAAAEGITYVVSTGDTGALGCDNLGESVGGGPVSANMLASTAFNVAVGGTMFNEHGQGSLYWSASNNPADAHSAKSYIPENAWNETCRAGCPEFPPPLAAGGGGASVFFSKPSWQSGVTGIPADGARDQPDVSLTAAGHDAYLLCLLGSCESGEAFLILGTSASAPAFAGMMALVDQKMGGSGPTQRQGQANYVLYRLAAGENLSQCNGSRTTGGPAANCIFNDITSGNIAVPGESGYGFPGAQYQAGTGYDLATGLGSINVSNLVSNWGAATFNSAITSLELAPTSIVHGQSVTVNASVTTGNGDPGPSGDISLMAGSGTLGRHFDTLPLTSSSVLLPTHLLPGGTAYQVFAHYSGDGIYAPSDSAPVSITVGPEASTTTLLIQATDFSGNAVSPGSIPYGFPIIPLATVTGQSGFGVPTGEVILGGEASNQIFFPVYALNNQGITRPTVPLTGITPGNHLLKAEYQADDSFKMSTSASVNFSIVKADTDTTLTLKAPGGFGSRSVITLTATIGTNSAGNAPSGSMEFLSGSTLLGQAGVIPLSGGGFGSPRQFVLAQGEASFSTMLPVGKDSITAHYIGDSNYNASVSTPQSVTVVPDFDISASSSTMTIASPGGSGTLTFTITGDTGYNGTVNFTSGSCVGLPRESKCSFSPTSVTGNGQSTLTISTTAPRIAGVHGAGWWTVTGLTFAGVLLGAVPRRRVLAGLLVVLAMGPVIGCGGGSGSSSGGAGDPGTPAGEFSVTVVAATGTLNHSAGFTLSVQ